MIVQSVRGQSQRRQRNAVTQFPAPFGGWNARDDVTAMAQSDALVLENFFPGDGRVTLRKGWIEHKTGVSPMVRTLMSYEPPDGLPELFAASETDIYDVTTAGGAVGAAVVSSLTSGDWQHENFSTAGGNFLFLANGADAPRHYNGATWATPSITGVTASNLITVTVHQSRSWMVEKNTMKVWYLPTLSVAGAATSIEFGGLSRLGGYLMAMASWTRDSGDGIEDLAVFITSRGEVHVYAGSDPSSSSTWQRVGTFRIAEPIGRRCVIKVGGDVGIITTQGLVPLAGVLGQAESAQGKVAITDKVRGAFLQAYESNPNSTGWQVAEYPAGRMLVLNVPVVDQTTYHQYAMNTATGSWSKFTGLNGFCWTLHDGQLYFGTIDGTVGRYGDTTDNGDPIAGKIVVAFSTFGDANVKHVRRLQPRYVGPAGYKPQIGLWFDYGENNILTQSEAFSVPGVAWDVEDWDAVDWAPEPVPANYWQTVIGKGTALAVVVQVSLTENLSFQGAKLEFELGHHL